MTEGEKLVSKICQEIDALHLEGEVRGIAAVMVLSNGDLRTLTAFAEGTKLPLLAGATLLQSEMIASARRCECGKDG